LSFLLAEWSSDEYESLFQVYYKIFDVNVSGSIQMFPGGFTTKALWQLPNQDQTNNW
jgi:hypothetical protein